MIVRKITEEVLKKRSEGIKKAKSSKEHRQMMSDITKRLWQTEDFRRKNSGRVPWNKIPNEQRIEKFCGQCNDVMYVVPSRKNKKFCSKRCSDEYKTGRIHTNWNSNSLKNSGYNSCLSGWYKHEEFSFRSSYELSAMVELLNENKTFKVEPFYIWYEYNGILCRYFPDLLIEDELVVEVKPLKQMEDEINILKFEAARVWCEEHGYIFEIWNEQDIKLLSNDEINKLVNIGDVNLTNEIKHVKRKSN